MTIFKRFMLVVHVVCLALSSILVYGLSIPDAEASPAIVQGDLSLAGNNVTTIEGLYHINGSILVEDNATLILRNAIVNFTQVGAYQYGMLFQNPANGQPRLRLENATITSPYTFLISFSGNSSADANELNSPIGVVEARDSSTMSVLNSTLDELSCQGNSTVDISDSALYECEATANASVTLFNCEISYFRVYESSTVSLVGSAVLTWLRIQVSSVNCFVMDLARGFINSWNFLLNCSVAIGAEGSASNLTLEDTTVSGWSFTFRGTANATIANSEIVYLGCNDYAIVDVTDSDILGVYAHQAARVSISHSILNFIFGYGSCRVNVWDINMSILQTRQSSRLWLVNSTSDEYYVEDQSQVYLGWYLDVNVTDSIGQPVPSANVTAYYSNATAAELKLTDEDGRTRLRLLQKMLNATGTYPTGNYTVEATYAIYSDEAAVNMTGNQQATLILEGFIIPEFSSLAIFPLFMALTMLVALLYGRKRFR